jgi:dTDP-4-amino-4,6-dideoxygalactose transaminase
MSVERVPFLSLVPSDDREDIRRAIDRVLARGWFVLGPEVEAFEAEFAAAAGASCAVGVGTGTDAIALVLRALGIGPGDEVITPPLSAAYTALAVIMAGASPVFADIDPERLTLDPDRAARAVTSRTRAILPVHLYGQPADVSALARLASRHNLALVEDCCQAHLATADGCPVGTVGIAGAFSFYPTKNLGALGDGGAVVTNDRALAERIKRLRNGGQTDRYRHVEFGVNSRLDELQAAILRARLPYLAAWTARRRLLAERYRSALVEAPVSVPRQFDGGHVYHLFVVRSPEPVSGAAPGEARSRDRLQAHLEGCGVETLIHYPIPIPTQAAFLGARSDGCPIATRICSEILSLPLHPGLAERQVDAVAAAVRAFEPLASSDSRKGSSPCAR